MLSVITTKRQARGSHVYWPDCGDGFMGTYLSKLVKLYTLNMCSVLYSIMPQQSYWEKNNARKHLYS